MDRIEFSVHEFMTIMGHLDEKLGGKPGEGESAVYDEWYQQWTAVDKRLESLQPLERADMLFDGKIVIHAITDGQLAEVIDVVNFQIKTHSDLIDAGDEDGDPEDLVLWQTRLAQLEELQKSNNFIRQ